MSFPLIYQKIRLGFEPRLIDLIQLIHDHPRLNFGLDLLVGGRQAVHLDTAELIEAVTVAVAAAAAAHPLAGHPGLEVLDHVPGSHVDALEDVHLCRRWRLRVRLRLKVSNGVDQDVVVQLLRVGAGEGRGIADKSGKIPC